MNKFFVVDLNNWPVTEVPFKGRYKYSAPTTLTDGRLNDCSTNKHPEEKAWDKCCGVCACRKGDGKGSTDTPYAYKAGWVTTKGMNRFEHAALKGMSYMDSEPFHQAMAGERPFYCLHQTDADGKHRVCGGWAKKYGKPLPAGEDQ